MSMKKNITIDGQEVAFKASAAIPRIRRKNGWTDLTPFPSIRYCPRSLNCGD